MGPERGTVIKAPGCAPSLAPSRFSVSHRCPPERYFDPWTEACLREADRGIIAERPHRAREAFQAAHFPGPLGARSSRFRSDTVSERVNRGMALIRRTPSSPPGTFIVNGTAVPLSRLPHDNYGPQLNFTIWLLAGLSAGFLGLRVYCKYLRNRGLWWDDHVLIVSWVS